MKATGIIRRIDDLGRVVIPKEIRRTMKIKEGDPLELFVGKDSIIFTKYQPVGTIEWEKAKSILKPILHEFALLDRYGGFVCASSFTQMSRDEALDRDDREVHEITVGGERMAYFVIHKGAVDTHDVYLAHQVLMVLFEDLTF